MPSTVLDPPASTAVLPAPIAPVAPPVVRPLPAPIEAPRREPSIAERIDALGPSGRYRAYQHGLLSRRELFTWAARYPDEVPLVNGELPWIALTLADLD